MANDPFTYSSSKDRCQKKLGEYEAALDDVDTTGNHIYLQIKPVEASTRIMKSEISRNLNVFLDNYKHTKSDLEKYNKKLEQSASKFFRGRKQKIIKQYQILDAIGVPLRKRDDTSLTYAIPTDDIRKKVQINKPVVAEETFSPEPTLSQDVYI